MKDRQVVARQILDLVSGIDKPQVAEIGVEVGKLSRTLLGLHDKMRLKMVDDWAVTARQPKPYVKTGDPSAAKTQAEQSVREAEAREIAALHPGRAAITKARSPGAAAMFPNSGFDLVFIDADHSQSGCAADIEAWWPKVKPGGWIGGHDYASPSTVCDFSGVKIAVDKWALRVRRAVFTGGDFTWWIRI